MRRRMAFAVVLPLLVVAVLIVLRLVHDRDAAAPVPGGYPSYAAGNALRGAGGPA